MTWRSPYIPQTNRVGTVSLPICRNWPPSRCRRPFTFWALTSVQRPFNQRCMRLSSMLSMAGSLWLVSCRPPTALWTTQPCWPLRCAPGAREWSNGQRLWRSLVAACSVGGTGTSLLVLSSPSGSASLPQRGHPNSPS
eukprot:9432280-Alexandrium_andersonii.AAC.1